MRKTFSIACLFFFLGAFAVLPVCWADMDQRVLRTVTGTVTRVIDGDTLHLTTDEQTQLKIRLTGIDAPEKTHMNASTGRVAKAGQPYGNEATNALHGKVMGQQVRVDITDIDKYRRMVGLVYLNSRNINLEMIREGHAECLPDYLSVGTWKIFQGAEQAARTEKLGIWGLSNYQRPSDFRRQQKNGGFRERNSGATPFSLDMGSNRQNR